MPDILDKLQTAAVAVSKQEGSILTAKPTISDLKVTHPEICPGYLPGMHAGFYDYDSETITLCDPWLLYDQEGLESLRDKFEGVLTHEFMHHLLFKMEGRETAEKYDNLFCQCNEWPPKCDSEERKRWEELCEYLKKKEAGEAN